MTDDARDTLRHRPLRVLVVDDESRWRDLLVELIPDMGFPARGARSAEEALDAMARDPHDILLFDLHLPSMSGMELFERVRERWPRMQGVVVTAYGELSAAQQAIRLRVAEFLTKPCHLSDIEQALERARRLVRATAVADEGEPPTRDARPMTLHEAERQAIADALARNHNNKAAAARELGISRRSLYDRLNATDER